MGITAQSGGGGATRALNNLKDLAINLSPFEVPSLRLVENGNLQVRTIPVDKPSISFSVADESGIFLESPTILSFVSGGAEVLRLGHETDSVNCVKIDPSPTGVGPKIITETRGLDTDIDLNIEPLGDGRLNIISNTVIEGSLNVTDTVFGTGTETLDPTAILELESTTKGFLPTRMTTAERDAISLPSEGLVVHNLTTNMPNYFDGTTWKEVGEGVFEVGHLGEFTANDATFPSSNPAAASSRNGHPILAFDDTTTEVVIFHSVMSRDYAEGGILLDIDWMSETQIADDATFGVSFERLAPNDQDIDSDGFATERTAVGTANSTNGKITRTTVTFTQAQADSIAAGDAYRLKLRRGDLASDTMADDAQVLRVIVRQ